MVIWGYPHYWHTITIKVCQSPQKAGDGWRGYKEDIPDNKHYIYKHSYEDMMDIRFGYIKVWI